jgi:hypothetical protein
MYKPKAHTIPDSAVQQDELSRLLDAAAPKRVLSSLFGMVYLSALSKREERGKPAQDVLSAARKSAAPA